MLTLMNILKNKIKKSYLNALFAMVYFFFFVFISFYINGKENKNKKHTDGMSK